MFHCQLKMKVFIELIIPEKPLCSDNYCPESMRDGVEILYADFGIFTMTTCLPSKGSFLLRNDRCMNICEGQGWGFRLSKVTTQNYASNTILNSVPLPLSSSTVPLSLITISILPACCPCLAGKQVCPASSVLFIDILISPFLSSGNAY